MFDDLDEMRVAFMEAFSEGTDSLDEISRVWDGAVLLSVTDWISDPSIELKSDEVYLNKIETDIPGHGDGGAALDWLTSLADEFLIAIKLHSETQDTDIITQTFLNNFYRNRGFHSEGDNSFMCRQPR